MRRPTIVLALLASLVTATAASSQERPRVGLGMGLLNTYVGFAPRVYLPIRVTPRIIVEPGFGVNRSDFNSGDATTDVTIQTAVLFAVASTEDGDVYLGPRLGVVHHDQEGADGLLHVTATGLAGGEYFLQRNFSLGGEVGLTYLRIDRADESSSGSQLTTETEFRVRWYFR